MIGRLAVTVVAAALLSACAGPSGDAERGGRQVGRAYVVNGVRYVPRRDPDYDEVGMASWYGPGFHGRQTASGQRFDMHAMTAAHTTLPFGTRVRVTNLDNDRSVVLTINDRGPFAKGRIVDVSRRAAERLGFIVKGETRVRVRAVGG